MRLRCCILWTYFFTFFLINWKILWYYLHFFNKIKRDDFIFIKVPICNDLIYRFPLFFKICIFLFYLFILYVLFLSDISMIWNGTITFLGFCWVLFFIFKIMVIIFILLVNVFFNTKSFHNWVANTMRFFLVTII